MEFEVRLRVKLTARNSLDASQKAHQIVQHLNAETHTPKRHESVFFDIQTVGVVEVIPTI